MKYFRHEIFAIYGSNGYYSETSLKLDFPNPQVPNFCGKTPYIISLLLCFKPPPLTNFLPKGHQYRCPTQAVVCLRLSLKAEALHVCMWFCYAPRQDIISRIQEYNLYKEKPRDKLTTKEVSLYCFDKSSSVLFSLSPPLSLPLSLPLSTPSVFLPSLPPS